MSWLLAQLTSFFVVPTICSLCVIAWTVSLSQFWMKWDDSMIGQKKKKAAYRADLEAALANNDLAELKKLRKNQRGGGQASLSPAPSF